MYCDVPARTGTKGFPVGNKDFNKIRNDSTELLAVQNAAEERGATTTGAWWLQYMSIYKT